MTGPASRLGLRALVTGAWQAQCVRVAAELGIPDQCAAGPMTSAELAAACGAHEPALRRLLRVLVAMSVLARDDDGRFTLTPLGTALGRDGLGAWAARAGSGPAWSALDHSIRTGEPASGQVPGMRTWEYGAAAPAAGERFHGSAAAGPEPLAGPIADSYDFSRCPVVVDVGGGDPALLAEILRRSPRIRGVLAAPPGVVERARQALADAGVLDRCDLRGGDVRARVPRGDAHVLRSVLHKLGDADSVEVLIRCREAAGLSGRVIIVERVLPDQPGEGDLEALLADLNMMVMVGGRERTVFEFDRLLTQAGLRIGRIMPAGTQYSIIETFVNV
ncbi:MAG TPA: methyltransferase [Streptosporangiaceae bacterium]|nr:methyltransferase [Streptosporangiaceae bacterium]